MANKDHLIDDESQLGPNWVPVNAAPIIPGRTVAAPSVGDITPVVPQYSAGSLPPSFQQNVDFVNTQQPTPNAPHHSLMPLGLSANSVSSAQITSVVKTSQRLVGNQLLLETDGLQNTNQSVLNIVAGPNITAQSDASGAVTITGAASSGLFTSRPDFKRWTLWAQNGGAGGIGGTGFTAVNDSIVNTQSGAITFTAIPPSSVDDFGFEQKITGGTAGNFSAITGTSGIIPARDFSVFCPIRLSTATAHMRVWVVATDVAGGVGNLANNDVPGATNIVGFRYSTTIGANWFAVVANAGTAQSEVDTGVPINSAVANMLRVDFDSASSTYTFFIDGLQVATLSTANNPSTTQPLLGFVSVACVGGVASTNAIRYSAFYTEMRTVVTTN